MNTIKGLILGSAAGLMAVGGAQAADLPLKAKAVEYVKVCSLYGAGFYYIPGTDTCIKIGGQLRLDVGLNTSNTYDSPQWQGGASGGQTRGRDYYQTRARVGLTTDTRTATEYGVLRTFADVKFEFANTRDNVAGGFTETDYAFIQFAGFTFGKAVSMFEAPWILSTPTISSYVVGASSVTTGLPILAYTASFGNGVSATISAEDGGKNYRRSGIWNTGGAIFGPFVSQTPTYGTAPASFTGNAEGGIRMPDIVGNIRLDQAWGSLHFAGALHNVTSSYYGVGTAPTATAGAGAATLLTTNGHPDDKFGYAFTGALELKNLPTGPGDSLKIDATYAKGAAKYVFGSTLDTIGGGRFAKLNNGGTMAFGYVLDGVFASNANGIGGSDISLSTSWGARAFFEHYWNPAWRTSVWGGYAHNEYDGATSAAMINAMSGQGYFGPGAKLTVTGGDMSINLYQVGTTTSWTPVKDLTLSAEFEYSRLESGLSGTYTFPTAGTSAITGTQTLGGQNLYNGAVRILRSF